MANDPKQAWYAVNALQMSLSESGHGLKSIPGLIVRVVNEELWREIWCKPTQKTVVFKSFLDFVTSPLPEGLGTDLQTLKNLCRDHVDATTAITLATKKSPGGGKNQHTECLLDNVQEAPAPTGNSAEAALRRLRKDRPDLHSEVIAGEKSPHAAMVEAGFRKKPTPFESLINAWKKADAVQRSQFLLWVQDQECEA